MFFLMKPSVSYPGRIFEGTVSNPCIRNVRSSHTRHPAPQAEKAASTRERPEPHGQSLESGEPASTENGSKMVEVENEPTLEHTGSCFQSCPFEMLLEQT